MLSPDPKDFSISTIIVTHNSSDEIGACIESVISQSENPPAEIIVVDNASSDATPGIVHSFSKEHDNVTVLQNDANHGFTKANNQGVQRAEGEYIFFLNPDTVLKENALQALTGEISRNRGIGAIAPQLRFTDGTVQSSCRRFPGYRWIIFEMLGLTRLFPNSHLFNGWKMGDFDHQSPRMVDQPAGAALMVRRSTLTELGGLDEQFPMFFSDVDLCRRIWDIGKKILFYPDAVVFHEGGTSIRRNRLKMIVTSHLSFIRYLFKHHQRVWEILMNVLVSVLLLTTMILRVVFVTLFPWAKVRRRSVL